MAGPQTENIETPPRNHGRILGEKPSRMHTLCEPHRFCKETLLPNSYPNGNR